MNKLSGHIVDVVNNRIFDGELSIDNGRIVLIEEKETVLDQYLLPGLVDAHIHIESSMLIPSEFARQVVQSGTVACVCDPHEIANVLGVDGIDFMIRDSASTPLKFCYGAPSCVPSVSFESAGAVIDAATVKQLMKRSDIYFLGEMMNFPGVLMDDPQVMKKIYAAYDQEKPIDGHAPLLSGNGLKKYVQYISTDHEVQTITEAEEKISYGMKVLIREGSASTDFEALYPLIDKYPDQVMFCTDDSHPEQLLQGHIDSIVKKAISSGCNLMNILKAACINPVKHYKLPVGVLQKHDPADFIVVNNLNDFDILETYINGQKVSNKNGVFFPRAKISEIPNNFHAVPISEKDLIVKADNDNIIKVIGLVTDKLLTETLYKTPNIHEGSIHTDILSDTLKLVIYNRYDIQAKPVMAFIHGFGLEYGAMASTIAHDNHNIIAVGCDDKSITKAINLLVENQGGIVVVDNNQEYILPLPIAGLMTNRPIEEVANNFIQLNNIVKQMGSKLSAPFMTLSFMSLLVIPHLKLGSKGLFDVDQFEYTALTI